MFSYFESLYIVLGPRNLRRQSFYFVLIFFFKGHLFQPLLSLNLFIFKHSIFLLTSQLSISTEWQKGHTVPHGAFSNTYTRCHIVYTVLQIPFSTLVFFHVGWWDTRELFCITLLKDFKMQDDIIFDFWSCISKGQISWQDARDVQNIVRNN